MKTYKYILLSVLFSFAASVAFAQDLIVKRDAEEIEAKVEEITDTHIKYHKFSNLEGPVYSVAKSEVLMIKYADGEKDVFTSTTTLPTSVEPTYVGGVMTKQDGSYHINGEPIEYKDALKYAAPYPEVVRQMEKATSLENVGSSIAGGGLTLMLVGLIYIAIDVDTLGELGGAFISAGGCLTLVGGGIALGSIGPSKKAVRMYNDAVAGDYAYTKSEVRLSLASTRGGLGLQLTF
jgi:hypothetical protein